LNDGRPTPVTGLYQTEAEHGGERVSTASRALGCRSSSFKIATQGREGPTLPEQTHINANSPELALLERVQEATISNGQLTQRELARSVGLSLGMTNNLVRRLVERGWLALERRSTKNIGYSLTPAGQAEIQRGAIYLRQASLLVSSYGERLEAFASEAKDRGVDSIILVGQSRVDSLLEGICERRGLTFLKSVDPSRASSLAKKPRVALVFAEGLASDVEGFSLDNLTEKGHQ